MGPLELQNKRIRIITSVIVIFISLLSFSKRDRSLAETSTFENIMIDSFAPIQRSVDYLNDQVSFLFSHYIANISASKNNLQLGSRIKDLEGRLFYYDELKRENRRLKELLRFADELPFNRILAQVVARDASSDFKVIRINKGYKDGIRLQSPVVTADGLVGYIFRLTDHFADVLTVLDQNNRVDGLIQRVRAHGIVEGDSVTKCRMKYVSRKEPIILNDYVITSGLGNIYPKGIKIGVVSRIEREGNEITQLVEITPSVDFGSLEEVMILIGQEKVIRKKEWRALDQMDVGNDERTRKK